MQNQIRLEKINGREDFPYFAQLVFNEKVMAMDMGRIFTQEEADGYFAYVLDYNAAHENAGNYKVFLADGAFIGLGALWVREDGTEVEYMVLPEYWGKGYATAILSELIDLARKNPDVHGLSGLFDPANAASRRVLEKNGFTFDRRMDVEEDGSVVEVYSREV